MPPTDPRTPDRVEGDTPSAIDVDDAAMPIPEPPGPSHERVGRGLVYSLGGVGFGIILAALVWRVPMLPTLVGALMAIVTTWLYTRGAGAAPRRGTGALLAVIAAGAVVCLLTLMSSDALDFTAELVPTADSVQRVSVALYLLTLPQLWASYVGIILFFTSFTALGTFVAIRQLRFSKEGR